MITLEELLVNLQDAGGSDLHVTAGSPPRVRVDGGLVELDYEMLSPDLSQKIIYAILDAEQIAKFEKDKELDLSFGISGLGRYRCNVYFQRGAVAAAFRVIPFDIKNFTQLGLNVPLCEKMCNLPKGLILITGATGSGKSTTLAAMINYINESDTRHIITIEDPIEFIHKNKKCLINQREVGPDTHGFAMALRSVLRQDPDVVLIGEMRDMETIEAGLTLAETGHLTFATLHTSDATQTINRIIDVFPANQQAQIRTQLSFVLEAVFCQQLPKKSSGKGRFLAYELMMGTDAVRALIRDGKVHQIYSQLQIGGKYGMNTMNQSLYENSKLGNITLEDSLRYSTNVDDLKKLHS
ncbi:MAG: type IV pili twitching motility protein PilT [Planctomycetota bacterium]|nr:MAG: type IV pili twitching motility protein PilT [Planctomycetota bacterium]